MKKKALTRKKSSAKKNNRSAFRDKLRALREQVAGNVSYFEDGALRSENQNSAGGSDASSGDHLAEQGTENYEKDRLLGMMESSERALEEIDSALQRIQDGGYGVCEGCKKKIAQARLRALPYARLCLKCQEVQERAGRSYSVR